MAARSHVGFCNWKIAMPMSARCCCAKCFGSKEKATAMGRLPRPFCIRPYLLKGIASSVGGGNAMLLRQALEGGMKVVLEALRQQVHAITEPDEI